MPSSRTRHSSNAVGYPSIERVLKMPEVDNLVFMDEDGISEKIVKGDW